MRLLLQIQLTQDDTSNFEIKFIKFVADNDVKSLENTTIEYIKQKAGNDSINDIEIACVESINKIVTPNKDGYYIFKTNENKMYVYKKTTNIDIGWVKTSVTYDFQQIVYFELIECGKQPIFIDNKNSMGSNNINNPNKFNKPIVSDITVQSYSNCLKELVNNKLFLKTIKNIQ
jgi:hypothetical protein